MQRLDKRLHNVHVHTHTHTHPRAHMHTHTHTHTCTCSSNTEIIVILFLKRTTKIGKEEGGGEEEEEEEKVKLREATWGEAHSSSFRILAKGVHPMTNGLSIISPD